MESDLSFSGIGSYRVLDGYRIVNGYWVHINEFSGIIVYRVQDRMEYIRVE